MGTKFRAVLCGCGAMSKGWLQALAETPDLASSVEVVGLVDIVEGAAKTLGEKAAVSALEEGEDHGLKDYKTDATKLDPECRPIIGQMLTMQQQTHDRLSALKRRLS